MQESKDIIRWINKNYFLIHDLNQAIKNGMGSINLRRIGLVRKIWTIRICNRCHASRQAYNDCFRWRRRWDCSRWHSYMQTSCRLLESWIGTKDWLRTLKTLSIFEKRQLVPHHHRWEFYRSCSNRENKCVRQLLRERIQGKSPKNW